MTDQDARIDSKIQRLKQEGDNLRLEVQKQTLGYILAAFGLVAGLAWNEAIKSTIDFLFPRSATSLTAKFLYALLVTLVIVLMSFYLSRLFKEQEKTEKDY